MVIKFCLKQIIIDHRYRAPELLVGDTNYGRAIDVWAIGCLLAELANGQPLFAGDTDLKTLQLILSNIGGKLTDKQRKALEKNPIFEGLDVIKMCNETSNWSIDKKLPELDENAKEILKCCLCIDPAQRIDCTNLLRLK